MKKVFVLVLGLFMIACGSDEKKKTGTTPESNEKTEEVTQEATIYPKLTDVPPQLNYIFDNGYEFADDIKVDFITLESKGGNKYQLIYGLEEETNLERLKDLKVSVVFYPVDPSLFKEEIYRKRKARQVPMFCKIMTLDGGKVIVQDFEIIPKEFLYAKFFFYNDDGVLNDKMLTVREINMPK